MVSVLKDITWKTEGKNGCVHLDVSRDVYYKVVDEVDSIVEFRIQRISSDIICEVFYETKYNEVDSPS